MDLQTGEEVDRLLRPGHPLHRQTGREVDLRHQLVHPPRHPTGQETHHLHRLVHLPRHQQSKLHRLQPGSHHLTAFRLNPQQDQVHRDRVVPWVEDIVAVVPEAVAEEVPEEAAAAAGDDNLSAFNIIILY